MSKVKEAEKDNKDRGPIICPGHSRPVPDLSYSCVTADGYFLISSCLDGKAMLREGSTGDWIGTFEGHKGAVWSARMNEQADLVCTAAADCTSKVWNALTGEVVHTFTHKGVVKSAVFSQDGKSVYTGGREKKIRIFDLGRPDAEPGIVGSHGEPVGHIIITSDPNIIMSSADEKDIRVWDVRSRDAVKSLSTPSVVSSMSLTTDKSTLCVTAGREVLFWDPSGFSQLSSYKMSRDVNCVALHPASNKFVTGSKDEMWVRVHDYQTGDELACNKGHHGPVRCLGFNPSGDNYASGSEDGTIRIWDTPQS